MFEKTTRPFTSEEIHLLRQGLEKSTLEYLHDNFTHDMYVAHGASLGCLAKLVVYIVGFSMALIVGAYIQEVLGVRGGLVMSFLSSWFLCFVLIRIINMRFIREYKSLLLSKHEEFERDLAEGYAVQWSFNAITDALRIENGEDFGYTLMMDVGDDHTLFISQECGFVPEEEDEEQYDASNHQKKYDLLEELPNSKFSIVYTVRSNLLIDVILLGEGFSPSQEIELIFDIANADEHFFNLANNKISLFPARLDRIREGFQQWLETEFDPSKFVFVVGY